MPGDVGPFEAFYASPIQHPWLLWLAAGVAVALCLARRDLHPSVRRYCLALGLLSFTDAWLTTDHVIGIGPLQGAMASAVPLFFVLAGDFRFLLLVFAGDRSGRVSLGRAALGRAAALTLVVPALSQVLTAALPESLPAPRTLFFIYEVSFALLTLGLLRRQPSARDIPWIRGVSRFVVLYYGLWATADAILLATGSDLGFALRVVPNVLYYGGLIAVIGRLAPSGSEAA